MKKERHYENKTKRGDPTPSLVLRKLFLLGLLGGLFLDYLLGLSTTSTRQFRFHPLLFSCNITTLREYKNKLSPLQKTSLIKSQSAV
ncbi:hypothetical protein AUJ65_02600 [Candidatus Micrarchaeota archaeon CG1_02_51_15]|nr:MAG: hypothetical protein AUJ65_02600 [Candidatus Micrarchaeota archaeon CG1_02_51_15]